MTVSAGLLLYRRGEPGLELLLAHPGGPSWARRDAGAWTLPKGEVHPGEDLLAAALREFEEETGHRPVGPFAALGQVRQKAGKLVHAWACEGNFDPSALRSNEVEIEWPPRSGRLLRFPEIDRVAWFDVPQALTMVLPAQQPFIERLAAAAGG